jgi:uncharacterized protein (DUF1778 family)
MKTSQLQIRVSPAQKNRLRRLAARAGMDVSSYVLARALPDARRQFDEAVRALRDDRRQRFAFAEIADLLRDASLDELQLDIEPDNLAALSDVTANYCAALIEEACTTRGVTPPAWVAAIEPLDVPWFATDLRSLREHLLVVSPPPFKRRNLFVDRGAGRV